MHFAFNPASRFPKSQRTLPVALLLTTTALVSPTSLALAQGLPTGARTAAGTVGVAQPTATNLSVTQTTQSAVVNWQGFSIGQGYSVTIQQPNASAALLNRVTGNTPSTIAGSLTANGQVYLVNPNGIAITSTGIVNAGGGFAASTLGISDADFMAGVRSFKGDGASAGVSNEGVITVGRGGYAALIGGTVSNSGQIIVPMGKVALGSGEVATLDFSGDGFLQVAVPATANAKGALIQNAGSITADGGSVIISAATARDAARNAVNISGLVQASTIEGRSGAIVIGGGEGGKVKVTGKLVAASGNGAGGSMKVTGKIIKLKGATVDASGAMGGGAINIGGGMRGAGPMQQADKVRIDKTTLIRADATQTGKGGEVVVWSTLDTAFAGTISARGGAQYGDGGNAEVSGKAHLSYSGFTDLSAAHGVFGTLMLDPFNVTISDASDINVSISNTTDPISSSFTATGNDSVIKATTLQTALGAANVTITTGSSGSQAGNITVASPLAWSGATVLTMTAAGAITINAPININGDGGLALTATPVSGITTTGLTFGSMGSINYAGGGSFAQQSFFLNGSAYKLVYTMTQLDAIDAIDGINQVDGTPAIPYGAGLAGKYALATNLDATSVTYTRALIGDGSNKFTGSLDGLGHTVTGLTINAPRTDNVGLIGYMLGTNSSVSNIGLVGVSMTGRDFTGGLVGYNEGGAVQTSYATGSVTGQDYTGGLVGSNNNGLVQASYATTSVTNGGNYTGGLVGFNDYGTVQTSYETGNVTGLEFTGGLVGFNDHGTVQTSYATGGVTGQDYTGGLVGANLAGTVKWAYATGSVTGQDSTGGLVGNNYGGTVKWSYAIGGVTGQGYTGGLVGSNDGTVVNNNWDNATTGQGVAIGNNVGTASGNVGLATMAMQDLASFQTTYTGWDFQTIWAPPNQVGQGGQEFANYPTLYALTPVVWSVASNATRSYGADNPANAPTISYGGPSSYVFGGANDALNLSPAYSTEATSLSRVGSYSIIVSNQTNSATSSSGVAYRVLTTGVGTLFVTPKSVTISGLSGTNKTYDGSTADALTGTATVVGLANSETLTLTNATAGTLASANAGTQALTTSIALGDGTGLAANYTLVQPTLTPVTVTPKSVTISGLSGTNKTYDGSTADALTGTATVIGLINSETLTLTNATVGTLASANAGLQALTTRIALGDGTGLAANYTLVQPTLPPVTVAPKSVTISGLSGTNKTYDGSTADALAGTATVVGLVNSETLTLTNATVGTLASANAGLQALTTSIALGDGTGLAANYTLVQPTLPPVTVTPKSVTIKAIGGTSALGTSPRNPGLSATGLQNGEGVSVLAGLFNSFGITSASGVLGSPYTLSVLGYLTNPNYLVSSTNNGLWIVTAPIETVKPAPILDSSSRPMVTSNDSAPALAMNSAISAPFSAPDASAGSTSTVFFADPRFDD